MTAAQSTCPWWCNNPDPEHATGGNFDSTEWDDELIRYRIHVRQFESGLVAVVQDEVHNRGVVCWGVPEVKIYGVPQTIADMTPVCAEMGVAAALIERIKLGQRPRGDHAAWCEEDGICGFGTDCFYSEPEIVARHQSAYDKRRGRAEPTAVHIMLSRNLDPLHQVIGDGTDDFIATIVTGRGGETIELDLTIPEARQMSGSLIRACNQVVVDRYANQ